MLIGASTASLFPLHTENALHELAKRGVKNVEIFLNATAEASGSVFDEMKGIIRDYDMNVVSLHPFSSPMESVYLFSNYDRRVDEMLSMYEQYFRAMNEIGASVFVLHGAILSSKCSESHYINQFRRLAELGREYGVTVAQENISYCKSHSLEFLRHMKEELGDSARFVLDIKQARRSGLTPFEIINVLGESIVHCHLSDSSEQQDCLPIGKGDFDFVALRDALAGFGYNGALFVELYRSNYDSYDEIKDCVDKLNAIWKAENTCN